MRDILLCIRSHSVTLNQAAGEFSGLLVGREYTERGYRS